MTPSLGPVRVAQVGAEPSVVQAPAPGARPGKRPRDPRLDFFRGQAMFIILIAHTPNNAWNNWIPARFGFSDATEIFVFCSGMASALAFGGVFARAGWWLGTARIAFRVWQVYWAHVGVFLFTSVLLFAITHYGWGLPGKEYFREPFVVPLFTDTGPALLGILTLTYVPGLFDILPMYLVILAMIPAVIWVQGRFGTIACFAALFTLWAATNIADYSRFAASSTDLNMLQLAIFDLGKPLMFLNLPGNPFDPHFWYFNPFAWQLVFFTGFMFGMGWFPHPPIRRWLLRLAAGYVILVIPFAWFRIYGGLYVPHDWAVVQFFDSARGWIEPFWWKSAVGGLRYLHFLAVAYLAFAAVGPGGRWLTGGFPVSGAAPRWLNVACAVVLLACLPYAFVEPIARYWPSLDALIVASLPMLPPESLGLTEFLTVLAAIPLVWTLIGPRRRAWVVGDAVRAVVPVITKVGTQSLAVFMVSVPLSCLCNLCLDLLGRDLSTRAATNLGGFLVLIATAYVAGWFKSHPWSSKTTAV